jgi:hypothetical protein
LYLVSLGPIANKFFNHPLRFSFELDQLWPAVVMVKEYIIIRMGEFLEELSGDSRGNLLHAIVKA